MHQYTRQVLGIAVGVLMLVGGSGVATAAGVGTATAKAKGVCPICSKASSDTSSYPVKATNTLLRGTANTLLGWTELIRQPTQTVKEGGNLLTGVARGVGLGVKRTLAGAGEVLTFWTPKVKNSYIHFAEDCPICMGKQ